MIKAVNEPEGSFYFIRKVRHLRSGKHEVFFIGLRFSASPFLVAPAQTGRREKSDAGMGNDHSWCAVHDWDPCGILYRRTKSDNVDRVSNRTVRAKSK